MFDRRTAVCLSFAAGILALIPATSPAQTPRANQSRVVSVPRTPDGHPDLGGIWTNATITPLERPAALTGKSTLTDAEAAVLEKNAGEELAKVDGASEHPLLETAGSNGTGAYNVLFFDRGSEFARVNGLKRTSLIVDPPDGRVPAQTPEARRRPASSNRFNSVKDRPLAERCLLGFGSTSGPPMLPVLYNNNYQIVQTPNHVMILVEMVHDARIIRLNGSHPGPSVRFWLGDSIGRWEGDTLVVDTTNFSGQVRFRGSSENLHVVERFTRIDAGTILYRATIDDPTTFVKSWTLEYPFLAAKGPIYEYACHEGNYSLTDILGGARKADEAATRQ
jgi:hypothetical protein